MGDLTRPHWMYLKAILFLLILLLSSVGLLLDGFSMLERVAFLFLLVWSSARLYYFMFYVIERYIDGSYRFSGIYSFLRYWWNKEKVPKRILQEPKHQRNLFEGIPSQLPEEIFEDLFQCEQLKVERIVSKGHTSPDEGWYDQKQSEWVLVLQGEAVLGFESTERRLYPGDCLLIPSHVKHKVLWTSPEVETIWLAIHFS